MADLAPLAPSYAAARAGFIDAAQAVGARLGFSAHPRRGREGEPIGIDVAELGPADAGTVLVVVSGTHGVEGYLGSALQTAHLRRIDPDGLASAVVFVHALNPFGFSWVRRVNEDNIDLNRNFIDWSSAPPRNGGYDRIAADLVPASWSEADQAASTERLLGVVGDVGMDTFQQMVSGGQYHHPTGLFYGGSAPSWSNEWLHGFMTSRLEGADKVVIVDLHTGLGPWGHGELISSAAPDSELYQRQSRWWDGVTSILDGSSTSAELSGEWVGGAQRWAPHAQVTGIALEYGTVDPITVMQALRADATLWANGDPQADDAAAIRAQVRAAFADDEPSWLATCWDRYVSVTDTALARLGD